MLFFIIISASINSRENKRKKETISQEKVGASIFFCVKLNSIPIYLICMIFIHLYQIIHF